MSRVTLRDVARKAGLSVTQVSRALNDHDDVAEATKVLARRVADELGYAPNRDAQRLRDPGMRSGSIGVFLPSDTLRFSDPFFGDLLSATAVAASRHGLQLQLATPGTEGADLVEPYRDAVRQRRVDGFVLVRTLIEDPRVTFLHGAGAPFVTFGRPEADGAYTAVDTDGDAYVPAISHLIDHGHRKIVCLAEPPQFAVSARRLESLQRALGAADLDPSQVDLHVTGFHEDDGMHTALEVLSAPDRPSAVVALNDLLALGVLRAAEKLQLDVPGDLSVIGFDDIAAARLVNPPLTTISQSATDVGTALIETLVPRIESRSRDHVEHLIPSTLVVRGSTGPARI